MGKSGAEVARQTISAMPAQPTPRGGRLRHPNLAVRLLIWFVLIALVPLTVLTLISYTIAERSLREELFTNLRTLAISKTEQIETYARERQRDVAALAQLPDLVTTMAQLNSDAAGGGGGRSGRVERDFRAKTKAFLTKFIERSGYEDVFLIGADGSLHFSLHQSADIGTNYLTGQYKDTQIARAFDLARTLIETDISEFGDYPVPGSAFVAAPILSDGVIIGVAAIQVSNRDLFKIVAERVDLGETGETVVGARLLAAPDVVTIAAPRFQDPDMKYANTISFGSSSLPALQDAVRGIRGEGVIEDYRGVQVIAAWRYLPSLRWGLVVKKDVTEGFAPIQNLRNLIMLLAGLTLIGVLLAAIFVARSLSNPIQRLTMAAQALSSGDLAARAEGIARHDEVGTLALSFNHMAQELSTMVENLEARVEERTRDLEKARLVAEQANQSKSAFLANMSHELRTPLNAILGFTQIMDRDTQLPKQQKEYVGIINRSGEHLLSLINDVLEMSKIEAGRAVLQEVAFDLLRLLQSLEEMLQTRADAKDLQLLFELDNSLPQYVRGDEGKLRQILINLLGNALKFTEEGGVVLRAMFDTITKGGPYFVAEIEDTGRGIPEDDLERIFQPFTQSTAAQATQTKIQEGTGLGLAITRQFIMLMGGDISVKSRMGEGTTFTLKVQLTPTSYTETEQLYPLKRVVGIKPEENGLIREWRILVVDDKTENRRLVVEWMRIVGFNVSEATNGEEAITVFEQWEPHLVWMDMRMPIMDGYEATRRIKSTIKGQATVVIALTASAFEHERAIVLSAGCDDFLRKPVREMQLFDKLSEHLGVKFIYADAAGNKLSTGTMVKTLIPERTEMSSEALAAGIGGLAPNQFAELKNAILSVDLEAAKTVLTSIKTQQPALVAALEDLIANFRFDQLQKLIQQADQKANQKA